MSSRECLRHRWLSSNRRTNGASKSSSKSEQVSSPDPTRRVGCSSCPPSTNNQNLRKYLSKSREALFEKVISRSKDLPQDNLRKSTLMSRYNKTRRMCESQMSLVSKSRERLLISDQQSMMAPSLHRSREKLYGLRSLSKSHEVLNLCKTVGALNTDMKVSESSPLRGILKTLTRATTTDFSSLPDKDVKEGGSKSSSTSSLNEKNKSEKPKRENKNSETSKKETAKETKPKVVVLETDIPPEVQPLQSVLTFICQNSMASEQKNSTPVNEYCNKENEADVNYNEEKSEVFGYNASYKESCSKEKHRPTPLFTTQLSVTQSEDEPQSPETNLDSLSLTEGTSTSSSEISDEDAGSLERITGDFYIDDDEPRYTVAQLVSAYNLHQEIVTKCSLEVTMSAEDLETKIPPIIESVPNKKFPTGPNALRLFIPNIDIASRTVKRTARKKPTMRPAPKKVEEIAEDRNKIVSEDIDSSKENEEKETKLESISETETKQSDHKLPNKNIKPSSEAGRSSPTREARYKLEKSDSKEKCRLSGDSSARNVIRSSSISSEASFKSSGASSNVTTSTEELTASDKRPRSSRSSGIVSSDGDHPVETWVKSGTAVSTSKPSDRLSQTTPRPNRKSFCTPRVPTIHTDSKTRRKSSPMMKPFY